MVESICGAGWLVTLAIATAWGMRQTDGALVYEMYRWVTSPLQPGASRQEILAGSYTQELQQRLVELEVQNRELQDMVGTAPAETGNTILAAVIGRSAGDWWQQVVISRGSRDGVREGYIVTGPGGLIGRVIAVSPPAAGFSWLAMPPVVWVPALAAAAPLAMCGDKLGSR
jgi:rod shape-determining protein MreC